MLLKAIELDLPPILIGRRIPYVTRRLLHAAGGMVWETRNQLYPAEYANIAAQMADKDSLGYFDIRVTDSPDANLTDFIGRIIPEELPEATKRFHSFKDLIAAYAQGEIRYTEFAARIRRRENGTNEDRDDEEPENYSDPFEDLFYKQIQSGKLKFLARPRVTSAIIVSDSLTIRRFFQTKTRTLVNKKLT
ncbi:MAG: hypothetical protein QHC89_09190 [Bosea sp. (in: a-proteobacteria)]|nr:hypothetical protein [Bosea sp. (in: a-proteobacteria)]